MKSQEMNKQPQPKKEEEKHSGHSKTMPQKRRVHPSTLINNPKIPVQQSTAIGFMADHFTDRKVEPIKSSDKNKLDFTDNRISNNFGEPRKDGGFI